MQNCRYKLKIDGTYDSCVICYTRIIERTNLRQGNSFDIGYINRGLAKREIIDNKSHSELKLNKIGDYYLKQKITQADKVSYLIIRCSCFGFLEFE